MMTHMRTIVDLPMEHLAALKTFCGNRKISRAEAVRRAVARLLSEEPPAAQDVGFGAWKRRSLNSQKQVKVMRDEWARK
jgi:metal-responsive CopG/Arc/MetJ family transcriptional regulator